MEMYKCPECGKDAEYPFMGVNFCKEHHNQETAFKHAKDWLNLLKIQQQVYNNRIKRKENEMLNTG